MRTGAEPQEDERLISLAGFAEDTNRRSEVDDTQAEESNVLGSLVGRTARMEPWIRGDVAADRPHSVYPGLLAEGASEPAIWP